MKTKFFPKKRERRKRITKETKQRKEKKINFVLSAVKFNSLEVKVGGFNFLSELEFQPFHSRKKNITKILLYCFTIDEISSTNTMTVLWWSCPTLSFLYSILCFNTLCFSTSYCSSLLPIPRIHQTTSLFEVTSMLCFLAISFSPRIYLYTVDSGWMDTTPAKVFN